jgi:hypothetical protein
VFDRSHGPLPWAVIGALVTFGALGCDAMLAAPGPLAVEAAAPIGSPAAVLADLTVAPPGSMAGYSRAKFPHWSDLDGDGCDTRQEVLARDAATAKLGRDGCVTSASVVLDDPYSGTRLTGGSNIDIDHVVALANAWRSGAAGWTDAEREQLANDGLNLLAVDDGLNQAKGDQDAAEWLPPNAPAVCRYVVRQIAVKAVYQLTVTPAEHDAMAGVLETCPDQSMPEKRETATP